jgi:hypothetical protein
MDSPTTNAASTFCAIAALETHTRINNKTRRFIQSPLSAESRRLLCASLPNTNSPGSTPGEFSPNLSTSTDHIAREIQAANPS